MSLEWIEDYVRQRRAEGLADSTAVVLRWKLKIFARWVKRYCRSDIRRLTPERLQTFLAWMTTRYRIPHGANRGKHIGRLYARDVMIVLGRFFSWLTESGRLLMNPAARMLLPRPIAVLPRGILNRREIKKLLYAPDVRKAGGARDQAILEVMYGTGLRRQEVYNLDIGEVDLSRGLVFVRRGKGAKDRVVPMGGRARESAARYLSRERIRLVSSPVNPALFVNDAGRRLANDFANRMLTKYALRCGIKRRITPHMIRHTVATHMLENGANVRMIQEMLGHASLDSTQIYTHVAIRHLRDVHRKAHPRARRRALTPAAA